jgi:deoxyribonuclease (pyrimidine dimer)
MTRINLVDPSELSREHLIAEYKEIMRLPNNLKKSLSRKKPFEMKEIPEQYVLGTGHVKFFYDKMKFIQCRFECLLLEMKQRGYVTNFSDSSIFVPNDLRFYNDYRPDPKAIELNRSRITERLNEKSIRDSQKNLLRIKKTNSIASTKRSRATREN